MCSSAPAATSRGHAEHTKCNTPPGLAGELTYTISKDSRRCSFRLTGSSPAHSREWLASLHGIGTTNSHTPGSDRSKHLHEPALGEHLGDNSPSRLHTSAMSKRVADVRMNAATLFTLPASIAADIVERLSARDVCALAQVCLRDQSPLAPCAGLRRRTAMSLCASSKNS